MAYRLDPTLGTASELRRVLADQLGAAVEKLRVEGGPDADAIHDVRKHLKKARSALRLARGDLGRGVARHANAVLRDCGQELASQRDALFQRAGRAQGRRFLTAGLAAVSRGDFELARGYTAVLERLRALGLPRSYSLTARLLTNRPGRRLLQVIAGVRRGRARRLSERSGAKAVQA